MNPTYVQLKQGVKDELQRGFDDDPTLNHILVHSYGPSNFYNRDILFTEKFLVQYDSHNLAYKIIEPKHLSIKYLSPKHIEPYVNRFGLDDSVFEWSEEWRNILK